ncbi:NAD(FAD)-dependent dehydrogenase [Desulfosporosinus orientis DSM 765]|uniref:NAD(FAD)-dependent dehydrogenase n=1 Tax=Desulfosporosinus orientis (strain ATCC 19365 / DSM 765 / NCIMB 8382 / VKM B-1628 / Singapore I) TaxID=768706 RepID=G7WIW2_DESOD|nr:DsrE/DsrF/DrsH-like family protein [Desulfosporosinus orientis]AET69687.1 NAD(FAD)-dependent dehydrogenase [Desulfosporosinus orientis DSM 765]
MTKKVLIVGGVAGGASAAARLRRLDEKAQIILFERDDYISFANCGLPYYIGETIKEREKLLVQTPEAMKARFNIDVRINSEVVGIDTDNQKVTVRSKDQGIYEESYDALVLSPGAKALRPNIPGINSSKIFTLRNIPDTDKVKAYVDQKGTNSAIVIGGGFVGVETAENLVERGLKVTLVEAAPHILAPFDSDMVVMAEKELVENGVDLILGDGVKAFKEAGSQVDVTLNSEKILTADLVILAIGVAPDTAFLKDSGIELGAKGHIIVDQRMQTNVSGVYAVGDAIEVVDFITGEKTAVPLAGPANKQGRIAADNIAGLNSLYKGTQGTSILKVFSLTAASTGANERSLHKANLPYRVVYVHPVAHASYYPAALQLTLKLIFNDEGQVLGAQGIGYDGVDKRIDVIAAVIRLKGTVDDLAELELAYAPPFSSAKDPVNMAGFAAQNVLAGRTHIVAWKDIQLSELKDTILLDVRTKEEYDNGHVPDSLNIPLDSLRERIGELDKSKPIIEYCQVGLRGYVADRILSQNGYNVLNITGGYKTISLQEFQPQRPSPESRQSELGASEENLPQGHFDKSIDACGLCCPGPLMQVKAAMDTLNPGQILKILASDPGFYEDIKAWCKRTNNRLIDVAKAGGVITAFIKKGAQGDSVQQETQAAAFKDNKTMVVFSGDLDKAIASFIIANGAAAMGKKVTMFFTFWGLNILRKHEKVSTQKGFMDKMFSMMMPRGSKRLRLSKMNMLGMGGKMIRKVMKDKNVSSLEELIKAAMCNGVEVVACQMSMDVMGLRQEELLDGVKIGGVGYYLGEAEDSNVNLFI